MAMAVVGIGEVRLGKGVLKEKEMARKKAPEKPANHERWLVSYGDFITLLFAVFVTLYAMSQSDKQKVEEVAASYRSAFGISSGASASDTSVMKPGQIMSIPNPNPQSPSAKPGGANVAERAKKSRATAGEMRKIKTSIKSVATQYKLDSDTAVEETRTGLVIRLKEAGFFEPGSAELRAAAYPVLSRIATALEPYSNLIRVEGYTDDTPISTSRYRSNWELSTSRAVSIVHVFLNNSGIYPENVAAVGYGEFHPLASNATDEGRQKNRRVDIVVLGVEGEGATL